jgi:TRAP-type C4-dicarboxylate transport system permease small subunit
MAAAVARVVTVVLVVVVATGLTIVVVAVMAAVVLTQKWRRAKLNQGSIWSHELSEDLC